MKFKEIDFKRALMLHAEGKNVFYTYHTSPNSKRYIGSLGLDHARRNKSWYKYYVEEEEHLRGYSLICREDNLSYDFVVAHNVKEAKKLMIHNCGDWIYDYENPILEFYAKWRKDANIEGLKHRDYVEGIDLIKRKICTSLNEYDCPICGKPDCYISELSDGTIGCSDCEDKNGGVVKDES